MRHLFVFSILSILIFPSAFAQDSIHVLTQNMWGLPAIIVKNKPARFKQFCAELNRRVNEGTAWDVVLLQEVWMQANQRQLGKCGYRYSVRGQKGSLSSGVMTLSKFPMIKNFRLKFSTRHEPGVFDAEAFAHKSALFSLIDHPTLGKIWFINTHMASGSNQADNISVRSAQFKQIAERIKSLEPAAPVIFGGDFNAGDHHARDASWETYLQEFPTFQEAAHAPDTCTYCPPNSYVNHSNGKIDHLVSSPELFPVSGGVALTEQFEAPITHKPINFSDHYGWESVFSKK